MLPDLCSVCGTSRNILEARIFTDGHWILRDILCSDCRNWLWRIYKKHSSFSPPWNLPCNNWGGYPIVYFGFQQGESDGSY